MHHSELQLTFTHHTINVNQVQLNYTIGGSGEPIILLHGWPQTGYAWRKVMPELAKSYQVIVPDLRGLGDSSRPTTGYDKKTAAEDIYQLVHRLGFERIHLVGHDIGGMVAYSYATAHPDAVDCLVVMECDIPGFGLEQAMNVAQGGSWHFGFHMARDIPEMLVEGKEHAYIAAQIRQRLYNPTAITEADINEYVRTYASPGGMRAGFEYYRSLPQDAEDNRALSNHKLKMPILAIGSEYGIGDRLLKQMQQIAEDLNGIVVEKSGHYIAEEKPQFLVNHLLKFLRS